MLSDGLFIETREWEIASFVKFGECMILITHNSIVFECTIHRFLSHFAFSHLYYGTTMFTLQTYSMAPQIRSHYQHHSFGLRIWARTGRSDRKCTNRTTAKCHCRNRFFACTANVLNAEHLLKDSFIWFGNLRNNIMLRKSAHHASCTVHYKWFSFHLTFVFFFFKVCYVFCCSFSIRSDSISIRRHAHSSIVLLHSCALCTVSGFLVCSTFFQFSF